ncbi:Fanconi anemia group B protein-like protein [Microtus ochrogaster]|uniref:Fanconi anemia group B protein-like protein n=1 Tax=Microtus ochrogaster TaxID=79684 RepID=A0A8J6FX93_MICOH|nr:Fanconi anemia group B protein-like protein [Microtus ochrogaster]
MVDHQLRMALIALTQKNQLILFQNGIPVRVCQLPFVDPCSVQILDSGKRNQFFIVSFNSKACAVSEKKFKVVAKWEQLSLILINDFVGVGTDQLLVIFDAALNTDQLTSFAITDFVRINFSDELVPFCDEDESSIHTPEEKLSENFQEPEHIVKQTWCRVLDDDLVIGLKVTSLNPNEGVLFHCLDQLIRVLPERCFFSYLRLGNEAFLMGHWLDTLEKELVTFCSLSTSAFEYARDGAMHKTNEAKNSRAAASEEEDKICLHKQEVQRERMIKDLNLKVNGSSYVQMTLALAATQLKSDLIAEKLANL